VIPSEPISAAEAIRRTGLVQRETVEGLDDAGLGVCGDTGESDPVMAAKGMLGSCPSEPAVLFPGLPSDPRNDEGIDTDALEQWSACWSCEPSEQPEPLSDQRHWEMLTVSRP